MELSKMLRDYSRTIAGKEQLLISAIAKALEIIPRQLCDNAGFDATNILNKLRQKHAQGKHTHSRILIILLPMLRNDTFVYMLFFYWAQYIFLYEWMPCHPQIIACHVVVILFRWFLFTVYNGENCIPVALIRCFCFTKCCAKHVLLITNSNLNWMS